jgi:hypothetical protein
LGLSLSISFAHAQSSEKSKTSEGATVPDVSAAGQPHYSLVKEQAFFLDVLGDQKRIWSAPLRFHRTDAHWLLPSTVIVAALIGSDKSINDAIGTAHAHTGKTASDAGLAAELGAAGAFWTLGKWKSNPHAAETGRLAYEAAINGMIANSAVQLMSRRQRPMSGPHSGDFLVGGSSFPSDHSAVAWSIASVVAHEYPGWATRLLTYGTAATVSFTRIPAQKHFASDVLVGGALGWWIGRETYRAHHDSHLDGEIINTSSRAVEHVADLSDQGSTYVPVDSWVYGAFDRLSVLGYLPSGMRSLRPWTRMECARILEGAPDSNAIESLAVASTLRNLVDEFEGEREVLEGRRNLKFTLDSVYTRFTSVSGTPLTDGFNFAQAVINDYGRPYQSGFNQVTGASMRAEAGRFSLYVRGEYQHSPGAPGLPLGVLQAISYYDRLPIPPNTGTPEINRPRLLDAYVSLNLGGWQASYGKQSLWWGEGFGGDLMLSNNAEPITMFRLTRVTPFRLPSVLGALGQIRTESFLGQLQGYNFLRLGPSFILTGSYGRLINPQPYVWGQKVTLQPTPNLQIGVSITTIFAGFGRPLTFDTFLHSFSSSGNAQAVEPGDRRTGFDFSYRIPKLRNRLVLYSGSMTEDEPNPIAYPRRSAMNPGIYLPQIPKLQNLDLHIETAYTNLPNDPRTGIFYTNAHYANGFTSNGQIMGSWIGPQARGYQVWSNYWQSGKNRMQLGYRRQTVDSSYVGGGTLDDTYASYDFQLRAKTTVSTGLHFESWKFPTLSAERKSNVLFLLQFTYHPERIISQKH